MSLPPLTVVIPTHDRADMIERAVKSAINQGYPFLEVIVVDDGSTDHTPQVLHRLSTVYPHVRHERLEGPQGPGAARNAGARLARGQYLAFLDSDDEWLPGTLAPRVNALLSARREGGIGVVGRRVSCTSSGEPKTVTRFSSRLPSSLNEFLVGHEGMAWPTLVVLKKAFQKVDGFDPTLPCSEWWDLCARLSQRGRLVALDLEVEKHYEHQAARQWTLERRIEASRILASKYGGMGSAGEAHAARRLRFAAKSSIELGRRDDAKKDYKASLAHRFSLRALIGFGRTALPSVPLRNRREHSHHSYHP